MLRNAKTRIKAIELTTTLDYGEGHVKARRLSEECNAAKIVRYAQVIVYKQSNVSAK